MARTVLEVVVAGDSKSLERAMSRSSKATEKFGKDTEKHTARATVGIKGIGKAAAAAGGVLAGGALVAGLKDVANAAIESEKSSVKLRAQLRASGISYKQYGDQIEKVIAKQSKLAALDDEDLQDAFTNLVRATGSASKSMRLLGTVSDVARAKNIDVAKAGEIVSKVYNGNVGVLKRYGIAFDPVTTAQDRLKATTEKATDAQKEAAKAADKQATATSALGLLQERFGGQAEAYGKSNAAAFERFSVASENLKEKLGAALLPTLSRVAESAGRFISQIESGTGAGGRFAATIGQIASAVGQFVSTTVQIAQTTAGFAALGAAVGALAGRFAGLAIAAVVTQIGQMAGAARAAGGAFAALSLAVKANPIGLLATAVGAVVGGLLAFAGANRDAKVSADDLTGAIDRQVDAVRRLKDLDIEAAQRKANVKTANAQLAAAERELAAARAAGDPARLKQAEAALAQAKVSVTRANRELKRAEEDATKVKRDAKAATDEAAKSARGRISTLTSERSKTRELKDTIRDQIRAAKEAGASRQQLAPLQKEHARLSSVEEKQTREVNKALRSLPKEVRSRVIVKFSLDGVSGFLNDVGDAGKRSLDGKGDGIGDSFHGAVSSVVGRAQSRFKASVPKVPSVGNGSGLNAFNGIANRFGVTVGSGLRPGAVTSSGNKSFHAMGMARDFPGPPAAMMRFFRFMKARYGPRLAELIYTPGGTGIKNGRPFTYTGKVAADHFDHVHVAMRPGGAQPMGDGLGEFVSTAYGPPWNAMNGTGTTATGVDLRPAKKAYGIAVDPRRVPLGSSVYAWPNPFGYRGKFKAFDTGGAIKGNRIDFYDWRGRSSQMSWGKRAVTLSTSPIGGGKASRSSDPNKAASDRARKQAAKIMQSQRPLKVSGAVGSNIGVNPTVSTALGVPFEGQPSFSAGAPSEAPPVPDKYLPGNAALALAGLTEDKADDLAALKGLQGMVSGDLAAAQARGDFAAIIELAGTLKGLNDQIASLNANVEQNTQALLDLETQRRQDAEDRARLATSQYGVLANALADVVNGNLGGRVGLGYQTPGFAGGGVRY